jgi:hypothetical protein
MLIPFLVADEPPPPGFEYSTPRSIITSPNFTDSQAEEAPALVSLRDIEDINRRLETANKLVEGRDKTAESVLRALIKDCDNRNGDMDIPLCQARTALIHLYQLCRSPEAMASAIQESLEFFQGAVRNIKPPSLSFPSVAAQMAYRVLKVGDFEKADLMFDDLVLAMEDNFGVDHASTVGLLVSVGITYQVNKRWADARPRFTRALSALLGVEVQSVAQNGLIHDLETTLENEAFPLDKAKDKKNGGWAVIAFNNDSSIYERRQDLHLCDYHPWYGILN